MNISHITSSQYVQLFCLLRHFMLVLLEFIFFIFFFFRIDFPKTVEPISKLGMTVPWVKIPRCFFFDLDPPPNTPKRPQGGKIA